MVGNNIETLDSEKQKNDSKSQSKLCILHQNIKFRYNRNVMFMYKNAEF